MDWMRIEAALWGILGLTWAVGAFLSRRTVSRESLASRLSYGIPLVVGGAFAFSHRVGALLPFLEVRFLPQSDFVSVLGVALTAAGIAFAIWARLTLGRLWSGSITLKEGHRIVQSGPYALARHPIYTGILLALLGTAVAQGTVRGLIGLAIITVAFSYKLSIEERVLTQQFGDEYRAYQQRVRRLVPFIW